MELKFKKLETNPGGNGLSGNLLKKRQFRRTLTGIVAGAAAGFIFYYFAEGMHMDSLSQKDIIQSIVLGGLFGLFVTNSPCARNRC